jgi:hypothetical protein
MVGHWLDLDMSAFTTLEWWGLIIIVAFATLAISVWIGGHLKRR